jgi:hypothetical protein
MPRKAQMSEHSWITNAGDNGRQFTCNLEELRTELGISTEVVAETLGQEVFYNEEAWAKHVSRNENFQISGAVGSRAKVSLGNIDILDADEYLEVQYEEDGTITPLQVFNGCLVEEWIPNVKPEEGDTVVLIDSIVYGTNFYMKSWLTFGSPKKLDSKDFTIEDFFEGLDDPEE